jgi:hypothetical protein
MRLERNQVSALLKRRPGLIIGPAQTLSPGAMAAFANSVSPKATGLPLASLPPDAATKLKAFLPNAIGKSPTGGMTQVLAKVRWSAVLSLSPDAAFEEAFTGELAKVQTKGLVPAVLEPPTVTSPPLSIPVIKLLGSSARDTFALSRAEQTRMKSSWAQLVRMFVDSLKGAPVVCIGLEDNVSELHELIALMLGLQQGPPSTWIFSSGDSTPELGDLDATLLGRATVAQTDLTIGELANAVHSAKIVTARPSPPTEQWPNLSLLSFSHIATPINQFVSRTPKKSVSSRALDLLFAPSSLDWEPFTDQLDFPRSLTATLLHDAQQALASNRSSALVITGSAASGKTTIAKRLALNLANDGVMTIWLRPPSGVDPALTIRDLVGFLADNRPPATPVAFVADDDLSHDDGLLRVLVGACNQRGLRTLLVTSVRNSDWETHDFEAFTGGLPLAARHVLDDDLDDAEISALPAYLTRIKVAPDAKLAKQLVDNAESTHARDLLGLFFFLLPTIRQVLRLSVQDEYFRLGDAALVADRLRAAAQGASDILKRAYELVAVSCYHRTPVPVEVLVSALRISYPRWLEETEGKEAAWGILYVAEDDDGEDARYRTRNSIVNDVIVRMVNGESIRPLGEIARLRTLLGACDSSNLIYRDYCWNILVDNKDLMAGRFTYEDGLELFETATRALPVKDKAIEHHKGLWMKNEGGKPLEALKQFDVALQTTPIPGAERVESDENIYTSKAAATLDAIDNNDISSDVGKREILAYLEKSQSGKSINPKAVHVRANLLLKLMEKLGQSSLSDVAMLSNHALGDLDSAITMYAGARDVDEQVDKNLEFLRDIRNRVLARLRPPDDLTKWAEELWSKQRDQQGFTLAGRSLLNTARQQGKGSPFKAAYDFVEGAINTVEKAGSIPSSDLLRVGLYALYEWRVRKHGGSDLSQVWRDLERLFVKYIRSTQNLNDPHAVYIGALALCHLDRWQDAKPYFSRIRGIRLPPDVLFSNRDRLLNTNGTVRTVFGQVKRGGKEKFIFVSELNEDFHTDRGDDWPAIGATTPAQIGLAYAGPTALRG